MSRTLVVILSETRASELTFENFEKNVLQPLDADLCVCIGVKDGYDYSDPFYRTAKYCFEYPEPNDYGSAFDYASECIQKRLGIVSAMHWRKFLKVKNQFMGGIKDPKHQHPGSAGILIFFRWFLMKNIIENNLLEKYDRFVITRSDFLYRMPHCPLHLLDPSCIWIPDSEGYGGYTDRHVILSKENIEQYLNILDNMVIRSKEYFTKMTHHSKWNLEQLIKFHLNMNGVLNKVRQFPYVMYAVRNIDGTTRWSAGKFNKELGYYVKYQSEYDKSAMYKKSLDDDFNGDLTTFYSEKINALI